MTPAYQTALDLFSAHNGILQTGQALSLGINPRMLYALRDAGLICRISRGIYQRADEEPLSSPDLVRVALRIPKAVVCLTSALYLHGLTSQIPRRVFIALPNKAEKPRLEFPPLDIIWLTGKTYLTGIMEIHFDGFPVKVYCREKTIADCFKFRSRIGIDVALEALKEYLQLPERRIDLLLNYARLDRVERVMNPYMEAIL